MRFRLRELLVALILLPPFLAVSFMLAEAVPVPPVLLGLAIYIGAFLVLSGICWLSDAVGSRWPAKGTCWCCGEAKRPMAEIRVGVLICRDCATACVTLIDQEIQKQGRG